jgi:predicted  nucleic acid-binding Zn-ribbon protein
MSSTLEQVETTEAVRAEIAAAARERAAAERQIATTRDNRRAALADSVPIAAELAVFDAAINAAKLTIERIDARADGLELRLIAALKRDEQAQLDKLVDQAIDAIAKHRAALAGYPKLAEQIAQICQLGEQADALMRGATQAAWSLGQEIAFDAPAQLRDICLPGYVGKPPPQQPPIQY